MLLYLCLCFQRIVWMKMLVLKLMDWCDCWHKVIISLLMNSVPVSAIRISGSPNFASQCCVCIISVTMGYNVDCYVMRKCINFYRNIWISFWWGVYRAFCIKGDSLIETKTLSFRILFLCFCFWRGKVYLIDIWRAIAKIFNPYWCIWEVKFWWSLNINFFLWSPMSFRI